MKHSPVKNGLKGLGSIPLRLSFLFKKVVVCGHCLVILTLTLNETLEWLLSLSILMQELFLSPHLHTSFSPSLISLMVSVDVNHHVEIIIRTEVFWKRKTLPIETKRARARTHTHTHRQAGRHARTHTGTRTYEYSDYTKLNGWRHQHRTENMAGLQFW